MKQTFTLLFSLLVVLGFSQNVGVGTNVPKSKLDVVGGLTVGGTYGGVNAAPANGAIIEGNVGIGTNNPDGRLSVIGSAAAGEVKLHLANSSTTGYSVIRMGESSTGNGQAYLHRFNSGWTTNGAWEASSIGFYEGVGAMNLGANTTFKVYTGSINNERMRITAGGNMGIGEASPAAKLDVNGDLILQSGVAVNEFSTDAALTDNSNTAIPTEQAVKGYVDSRISATDDWTKTGNDIYNNNSGNVSIGTSSSTEKLTINGTTSISGSNFLEFGKGVSGKENNAGKIGYQTFTAGALDIVGAGTSTRVVKLWDNVNVVGELTTGGNIGVGTTTTTAGINVAGDRYALFGPNSSWNAYLQVGGNGSVTSHASVATTNGNLHLDAASGGSGIYLNWYKGTGGVNFGNGSTTGVGAMTSAGYFGVGTTGPGYPLHVVTTRSGDWSARFTNGSSNVYLAHADGYGMHINTGGSSSSGRYALQVRNASQEHLYVRDDGYTGVGTDAPAGKLDVRGHTFVGSSDPQRQVKFTDGWTGYPDNTSAGAEISNDNNAYKTLMLVGNRSSGIRKVSVWDRLEVNGSLNVSGATVVQGYGILIDMWWCARGSGGSCASCGYTGNGWYQVGGDFNQDAGGDYIYLCARRSQ